MDDRLPRLTTEELVAVPCARLWERHTTSTLL